MTDVTLLLSSFDSVDAFFSPMNLWFWLIFNKLNISKIITTDLILSAFLSVPFKKLFAIKCFYVWISRVQMCPEEWNRLQFTRAFSKKVAHAAGSRNWIFQLTTKMYRNRVNGWMNFQTEKVRPTNWTNECER